MNVIIKRYAFLLLLALALLVITIINLVGRHYLPDDPRLRIARLRQANLNFRAESIYKELLIENSLDLDLHYNYINNHFDIFSSAKNARDDKDIEDYYAGLCEVDSTADIGSYGFGLIRTLQQECGEALDHYRRVRNRTQKYLNNSTGYAFKRLDKADSAESYFWREIEINGNIAGAVTNLSNLYSEANNLHGLTKLVEDGVTRPFLSLTTRRMFAFRVIDLGNYFRLTFLAPLGRIKIDALLVALVICAMWFAYFSRIDVFEGEPIRLMLSTIFFGGFFALASVIFFDFLFVAYPLNLRGDLVGDLIYSILHIGLIEELVKFLPILIIIIFTREINEPVDLMIYGSLSALGFATLENCLYFTGYGLSIAFTRFLFSTVIHMALTGIVCYACARTRYIRRGSSILAIFLGLIIASVVHGLFDYFLLGPLSQLSTLSFFIVLFMAIIFGRMITNTLNFSPYFDAQRTTSRRLHNYNLLLSTALVVLAITYLSNNFYYSTEIANMRLMQTAVNTIFSVAVVFGALGEIGLKQGTLVSLLKFIRAK